MSRCTCLWEPVDNPAGTALVWVLHLADPECPIEKHRNLKPNHEETQ